MRLDFVMRGLPGYVDVEFGANDDPSALGAEPAAVGLAYCQATVSHAGRGRLSRMGWVQMVRSTDGASGAERFEMDPLEVLGPVAHPFCYFGIAPTMFDAPARDDRQDLDWIAHSFLAYVDRSARREVRAVLGFSWGFTIVDRQVTLSHPVQLDGADWTGHGPMLAGVYPDWLFAEGFSR